MKNREHLDGSIASVITLDNVNVNNKTVLVRVDISSVAAVLLDKAIGDNLFCVFVNNGLLRKNE